MRHLAEQVNEQRDESAFVMCERTVGTKVFFKIFQYKLQKHKSSTFDSFITFNSKMNFFIMWI